MLCDLAQLTAFDDETTIARMAGRQSFPVVYVAQVEDHLRAIDAKYHTLIRQRIESQLALDPDHATRNRTPLKPPSVFGATWELRCGPLNRFRVLYDIDAQSHVVHILAIGVKVRNRLFVGGEETKP
jgi:hypothetical protein